MIEELRLVLATLMNDLVHLVNMYMCYIPLHVPLLQILNILTLKACCSFHVFEFINICKCKMSIAIVVVLEFYLYISILYFC